jgi:hypothetical protein
MTFTHFFPCLVARFLPAMSCNAETQLSTWEKSLMQERIIHGNCCVEMTSKCKHLLLPIALNTLHILVLLGSIDPARMGRQHTHLILCTLPTTHEARELTATQPRIYPGLTSTGKPSI